MFDEERRCNDVICDCRQRIESSLRQEGIVEDLEHKEEVIKVKEDFSMVTKSAVCHLLCIMAFSKRKWSFGKKEVLEFCGNS